MSLSTIWVSDYELQYIRNIALYVHLLCFTWYVDGRLPRYEYNNTQLYQATDS
jgi:hypothetical protein